MSENGTAYVVYDDIPLESFDNLCLPPMPAKDVVVLLAEDRLSPAATVEIRTRLIDAMMPENPNADRGEIEAFVDSAIADVRAIINHSPAPE
jgi:hypothetical protein